MKAWLVGLATTGGAVGVVMAVAMLPPALLLRLVHILPSWADGRIVVFVTQAVLVAVVVLMSRASLYRMSPERVSRSGLRAGAWLILGTFMVSVLVSVTVVMSGPSSSADGSRLPELLSRWGSGLHSVGFVGSVLLVAVLAPILEEVLFRGYILGVLLRRSASWFGLLVSTALFATGHDSWLFSGLLGSAFGLLYLRFESVWLCSLVHGTHNLVSAMGAPIAIAYLHDERLLLPIEGSLLPLQLTWLIAAFVCFAMFLWEVLGGLEDGPLRFMLRPRPALA